MDINEILIEERCITLFRKRCEIKPIDFLSQIDSPALFPCIYWNHREDEREFIAFGALLKTNEPARIQTKKVIQGEAIEPALFGYLGYEFTKQQSGCFVLPKIILEKSEGKYFLNQYSLTDNFEPYEPKDETVHLKAEILSREDSPNQKEWQDNVLEVLNEIEKEKVSKVVLARKTKLELSEKVLPSILLEHLKERQKNCTFFSFQYKRDVVFIGASPECLFTRKESEITTEALAGTCKADAPSLLHSKKELHEFNIVKNDISRMLHSICSKVKQKPNHMVSTGTVQHIHSSYLGRLKANIEDAIIVKLLHPTPAICGTPRLEAQRLIEKLEPFKRELYAAPLGFVSENLTQFIVGIRSALIEEKKLTLYAGCGLLEGSDPQKEWEELESKIASFMTYFKDYAQV